MAGDGKTGVCREFRSAGFVVVELEFIGRYKEKKHFDDGKVIGLRL